MLRSSGRLSNAENAEDAKEATLLPKYHPLTKVSIMREHERTVYGRLKDALAELRSEFWVLQQRQEIRKIKE